MKKSPDYIYTISKETLPDIKGAIIAAFEHCLYKNKVNLKNPERDEAINEGNQFAAIIYGSHFDTIGSAIEFSLIKAEGIPTTVDFIYDSFMNLLKSTGSTYNPSKEDQSTIRQTITSTLLRYGYKKNGYYNILA